MNIFENEQTTIEIAGIPLGGQPGELPTVLIGSFGHPGHKIIQDFKKGVFDKTEAERVLNQQDLLSEQTGNPAMVDVMGTTPEALITFINFVADTTDVPFLIDGTHVETRLAAAQYSLECGLGERAIYNSIDYYSTDEELQQLKEIGLKNTILLAFNPLNALVDGSLEIVSGTPSQKGLLEKSNNAQITNNLIDTGVFDVPSIGLAARTIHAMKSHLGLPVGCAPANGIGKWKDKVCSDFSYEAYTACAAAAGAIPMVQGADFIIYGPIVFADQVFPVCAMTDAIVAYHARQYGVRTKIKTHPLHRIF